MEATIRAFPRQTPFNPSKIQWSLPCAHPGTWGDDTLYNG
jgi:hypothetical protein